jgi:hypothetical protein
MNPLNVRILISPGQVLWDLWWIKWRCGRFLLILKFPLPIFIPPIPQIAIAPSSIIRGWYNMPILAAVLSGLSLTPLTIIIQFNSILIYLLANLTAQRPITK